MSLWVFVEWEWEERIPLCCLFPVFMRLSDIGLESTCIQYDLVFIWLNWKDHILVPNQVTFSHRYQGLGHEHVILRMLLCPLQMAALWVKDCRKYEGPLRRRMVFCFWTWMPTAWRFQFMKFVLRFTYSVCCALTSVLCFKKNLNCLCLEFILVYSFDLCFPKIL